MFRLARLQVDTGESGAVVPPSLLSSREDEMFRSSPFAPRRAYARGASGCVWRPPLTPCKGPGRPYPVVTKTLSAHDARSEYKRMQLVNNRLDPGHVFSARVPEPPCDVSEYEEEEIALGDPACPREQKMDVEYVGTSLASILERGSMSAADVLQRARPWFEGVALMAEQGIVHADVKPENMTLGDDAGAYFIDFEYVLNVDDPRSFDELVRRIVRAPSTPQYRPPEFTLSPERARVYADQGIVDPQDAMDKLFEDSVLQWLNAFTRRAGKLVHSARNARAAEWLADVEADALLNRPADAKVRHDMLQLFQGLRNSDFNLQEKQIASDIRELQRMYRKYDVYALGLVLQEVLIILPSGRSPKDAALEAGAWRLAARMTDTDVAKRISAREALDVYDELVRSAATF